MAFQARKVFGSFEKCTAEPIFNTREKAREIWVTLGQPKTEEILEMKTCLSKLLFLLKFGFMKLVDKNLELLYDPYGPARAFIAKLLRKFPYEGRT